MTICWYIRCLARGTQCRFSMIDSIISLASTWLIIILSIPYFSNMLLFLKKYIFLIKAHWMNVWQMKYLKLNFHYKQALNLVKMIWRPDTTTYICCLLFYLSSCGSPFPFQSQIGKINLQRQEDWFPVVKIYSGGLSKL